jgi:hypothetical protein
MQFGDLVGGAMSTPNPLDYVKEGSSPEGCYPDESPDDLDCWWCGGEHFTEGKDPFWDEGELVTCPNCRGSGLRKDMTFW